MKTATGNPAKDPYIKPWFIASIAVTVFLILLLGWNLVFSFNLLDSFKNEELSAERCSWKLLLYSETLAKATRVSALSGNLKWKKVYDETRPKLEKLLQKIPEVIDSGAAEPSVREIRKSLENLDSIEKRVYVLLSKGRKDKAQKLLAGWEYTKNQMKFEEGAHELVKIIKGRVQQKIFFQKRHAAAIVFVVTASFCILVFSWTVTIRSWRSQAKEKKDAERALRQSEEKYRKLFNTSPDAVCLVDEEGRILTANPSMSERLCLKQDELAGRRLHEIMAYDQADREVKRGRQAMESQDLVYCEDEKEGRSFRNYYIPVLNFSGNNTFQIISRDVTEQKEMEEKLREMSLYDSLTGIYSRSFFKEEVNRMADGRHCPVGIIICDLDGLKLINDTMGHEKGDALLREAASVLRECFRASDVIARIGGDEFAVLLPGSDEVDLTECCSRIRKELARRNSRSLELSLSISIGYAVSYETPVDMDYLFKRADNAMYREKFRKGQSTRDGIIRDILEAMERRDFMNEGHEEHLREYACKMAENLELSKEQADNLDLLVRFHDLGKAGISDSIMFKPGPLTNGEFTEVKRHCEIGYRIAMAIPEAAPIADLILKHHEWWNGQGYPLGLKGEEIPLECRIFSIIDAYDAATSNRPYKKSVPIRQALEELKAWAGVKHDPELTEVFVQSISGSGMEKS